MNRFEEMLWNFWKCVVLSEEKKLCLSFTSQRRSEIFESCAFGVAHAGSADGWLCVWKKCRCGVIGWTGEVLSRSGGQPAWFLTWAQAAVAQGSCWSNPSRPSGDVCVKTLFSFTSFMLFYFRCIFWKKSKKFQTGEGFERLRCLS